MNALDELDNLAIMLSLDEDTDLEEYIVTYYTAMRLKPLMELDNINENYINNIADHLIDNYFIYGYSLDLMINAIYNYANKNKRCPSNKLLTDDIEILLKEYANG